MIVKICKLVKQYGKRKRGHKLEWVKMYKGDKNKWNRVGKRDFKCQLPIVFCF